MLVVTGANGFIGSALVAALNAMGHSDLWVTDFITIDERHELLASKKYARFLSPEVLLSEIQQNKPSAIFHMGACSSTTEKNWEYLKSVNLDYSQKLFSLCAQLQVPLYYASSGAVYGDGAKGFDDRAPTEQYTPLNLYGKSKHLMDVWASSQTQAPPRWAGFRFFNVYGPNEYFKGDMASVAYKAFLQIRETGRLKLFKSAHPQYADGHQLRDFIYVKDVTRWMLEAWQLPHFKSGIYNMGSGQARTWLDLAHAVFRAMGKKTEIEWIEMPDDIKKQYQYYTEARMQKLFSEKLSKPEWTLEKGVTDYVMNYLMRDQTCY